MAKLKTTVVESTEETTAAQATASISTMSLVDESENTDQPVATITEDETGTEVVDPAPETEPDPTLSLDVSIKSVSEAAGTFIVNVTTNSNWTTSNVPSWISLSATSGSGDQEITVSYNANETYTERSGSFSFNVGELTESVTVTQNASVEPTLTLSVKTKSVSETAGSFNVNITSNSDWTSSNVPSWITLTPAQGSGDQTVKVAYTANAEYTQRSESITFSVGDLTQTLTVTQSASPEPEPEPDPEPEGDEPDDFADQILKCFPREELMYIDRQGGLYVQNTEEHIRKNAVLYTNPYFKTE